MADAVAFLGLGTMGKPMARNLLKQKIPLYVYNRSLDKTIELAEEGAHLLNFPSEAFQKASIAFTMLANDKALEDVTLGRKGLLESIQPGNIHVSLSTTSPDLNRKLDHLHREKKAHFISAPVFGRPEVAAAAKLWISVAGEPQAKKRILPLLKMLGQRVEDFGEDPGAANVVKLIGNFLMLSAMEAMGEAWALGEANGISSSKLSTFFSETLFSCPIYQTYGKIIAESAFDKVGLKLSLGLKDITLAKNQADSAHVHMPFASLLQSLLQEAVKQGHGELDWSAVTLFAKEKGAKTKH